MKVAIMQPYFLPYIGYFQLIGAVDVFIVYDNIKYTKRGWINRNRMLQNGKDVMFSLPLKSDSDLLNVCDRELAADFKRTKMLNQISDAYRRAPYFAHIYPLIEKIVTYEEHNLFKFLQNSIATTCKHLGLTTKICISSSIAIDHNLKSQDKVLALCEATGASTYVNAIGGIDLYSRDEFKTRGIELKFSRPMLFEYTQFGNVFVPWLSIIDVMMFNSIEVILKIIKNSSELVNDEHPQENFLARAIRPGNIIDISRKNQ